MKKQIILAIALTALPWMSALSQYSQQGQEKPQISMSGSAEIKVVPDEIYLYVGIETRDVDLKEAKKQNDDRVSGALNFLKHNGVQDKDVKTDFISIEPVYDTRSDIGYVSADGSLAPDSRKLISHVKPIYFVVQKSIGIKMTNIASFDTVLSGLVTNGVNTIQGIQFRTSELRKYRDKARTMAIQAAKEKAEAMASQLGIKLGKATTFSENDRGGWSSWSQNGWVRGGFGGMYSGSNAGSNAGGNGGGGAPESDEGTLSVGQISVFADVTVTFSIK